MEKQLSTQTSVERPTSVTVAVAFGWLAVILDVISAVALILLANNSDVLNTLDVSAGTARVTGIVVLVIALVLALVVLALSRGSNVARILVGLVMLLRIAAAVYLIIAFGTHNLGEALMSMAVAIAVIALLFNDKANAYFR